MVKNAFKTLFYHYRKFLHFKVFPYFSRCDYKVVWLIKEKLLDTNLGTDYDPEFGDGLNLETLATDYMEGEKFRDAMGEIEKTSKTSIMMEFKKKIEKLEANQLVEIQSEKEEGRHVKWIKFNLNWNAFPIFYSLGVFATFLVFHGAQVLMQEIIGLLI